MATGGQLGKRVPDMEVCKKQRCFHVEKIEPTDIHQYLLSIDRA